MATAILASITDTARAKHAEMLAEGRAFTVTQFITGSGGHDPGDPATALTPDPALSTLPEQSFGPKTLADKSLTTPFCVRYVAELDNLEAVGLLSNIGLVAQITFSPIPLDPLVGTTFLFAVGNFPLIVKTDAETRTITIQVQY